MIELYLKTNEVKKDLISEIDTMLKICLIFGLLILQIVLKEVSEKFGIDMSILIKEKILK
jgi:hypothetical protein